VMQEVDVIRPAAVFITNLLEGAKHVEDRGRTSQTYTINGISGYLAAAPHPANKVHPFVQEIRNLTDQFVASSQKRILSELGQRSGYGWFHRFAGLFESYWAIKRTANSREAGSVKLVWLNERDDDVWVVVPTSFRWRRAVPKNNFTYSWSVTFEVIEDFHSTVLNPFADPKGLDNIDANSELVSVRQELTKLLSTLRAIATRATDFIRSFVVGIIETIVAALAIIRGIQEITAAVIRSLGELVSALFNLSNFFWDTVAQFALATDSPVVRAMNEVIINSTHAFHRAVAAMNRVVIPDHATKQQNNSLLRTGMRPITSILTPSNQQESYQLANQANPSNFMETDADALGSSFYGSGLPPYDNRFVSLPLDDFDQVRHNTYRVAHIQPNDSIYTIAKRELGDASRFVELITANDIDPPYVVPKSHDASYHGRVLKIGDPIKIPETRPTPFSQTIPQEITKLRQGRSPQASGLASSGSSILRLVDGTRNAPGMQWALNQWEGYTCSILSGTGVGERAVVRRSDNFSVYFFLEGTLAQAVGLGASSLTLSEGQAAPFPTLGRLILDPGLGTQEEVFITGKTDDTLTFVPITSFSHTASSIVYQIDSSLTTPPDTTTQYLLWLDEQTSPATRNTPDAAFGLDLRLQINPQTGKWDLVESSEGDADVVVGLEAYAQSLRIALSHSVGGNPLAIEDGIPKIIGRKLTSTLLTLYLMYVRRVIFSDPRTVDVISESITVNDAGDVVELEMRVLVLGGAEASVGVSSLQSIDFPP